MTGAHTQDCNIGKIMILPEMVIKYSVGIINYPRFHATMAHACSIDLVGHSWIFLTLNP